MKKIKARKRFGQNFLQDGTVINQIIAAINPKPSEAVVEIGPGLGALTKPLLQTLQHLHVIELDRDLIPLLQQSLGHDAKLTVHSADALNFDYLSLLTDTNQSLRLIGNLPYNITTPLIFHLLDFVPHIMDMHFMLQKEVVERLAAQPNCKAYGKLSIMVQYFCQVDYLFDVPPQAFTPQPKVDSAVVRLQPYTQRPWHVDNLNDFTYLLRHAFSQRRKTLRNNLKGILSVEAIETLGIDTQKRPECLTLPDYVSLSNLYSHISSELNS